MLRWLGILFGTLRSSVRTHRELALKNLTLRQQVAVLKPRQARSRLTEMDRIFWVLVSRLWTSRRPSLLTHSRRRLVHFNVTEHPTAEWTARQLLEACARSGAHTFVTD